MGTTDEALGRFVHGGDTYGLDNVVDFSASMNPMGMPLGSVTALVQGIKDFGAYPDPLNRELLAALSEKEGIAQDQIVIAAGATDVFWRIVRVLEPKRVLVCDPCFAGYEESLTPDVDVVHHALDRDNSFDITEALVDDIAEDIDIVYLCTPNNPTGRVLDTAVFDKVLARAEEVGAYVVLDECFAELAGIESSVPLCASHPKLIVVKAFTKTYAMAGLRLGYGMCGDVQLVQRLRDAGMPWAVSLPAQIAGVKALEDKKFISRSVRLVNEQRDYLIDELRRNRMKVIKSQANFILFESPVPLYEGLLERGFLIRRCQNFCGLDGLWYRIAVRAPMQNEALMAALEEVRG